MDFTIIPKVIKETLEKAGQPLTDDQYMLICGTLAGAQQMIDNIGLESTIEVLLPMKGNP